MDALPFSAKRPAAVVDGHLLLDRLFVRCLVSLVVVAAVGNFGVISVADDNVWAVVGVVVSVRWVGKRGLRGASTTASASTAPTNSTGTAGDAPGLDLPVRLHDRLMP